MGSVRNRYRMSVEWKRKKRLNPRKSFPLSTTRALGCVVVGLGMREMLLLHEIDSFACKLVTLAKLSSCLSQCRLEVLFMI